MRPSRPEDPDHHGPPEHPHRRDPRLDHWAGNPWGHWAHGRGPHARWHRNHPHGPWFRTRLGRYLHAKLHRRIFIWFGFSILVTGLVVATVMNLVGGSSWRQNMEQLRTFASNRFAEVWDAPQQRDLLVQGIARDLSVDLELHDATGALIRREGAACDTPDYSIPVLRSGVLLGTVEACYSATGPAAPGASSRPCCSRAPCCGCSRGLSPGGSPGPWMRWCAPPRAWARASWGPASS